MGPIVADVLSCQICRRVAEDIQDLSSRLIEVYCALSLKWGRGREQASNGMYGEKCTTVPNRLSRLSVEVVLPTLHTITCCKYSSILTTQMRPEQTPECIRRFVLEQNPASDSADSLGHTQAVQLT